MRHQKKTTVRSVIMRSLVVLAVVAALVLAASPRASAEEGYDLMRQITTQWVKPLIMIVFDRSGSMFWTADENGSRWNFKYNSSISGYISSASDWTYSSKKGHGQGFWVRVKYDSDGILKSPPSTWVDDGYTTSNAFIDRRYRQNIYSPENELPSGFQIGDLIRVSGYPVNGVDGIFMVSQESRHSGANPGYWYTKFYKMNPDGTFDTSSSYTFPLVSSGSNVTGFTVERVVFKSDKTQFTLIDRWRDGQYVDGNCYVTIWGASSRFRVGQIVKMRHFKKTTGANAWYFIRRIDGNNVYVSHINNGSGGTYPNQDYCFPGVNSSDYSIQMRPARLPMEPLSVWYFMPPSRIAIAKNVWGDAVTLYHPSVEPTGYDERNKPYYVFHGEGPVNGAWKEWNDSSDNGYSASWHNWSSSVGHEPVGDPDFTDVIVPTDMVSRFSKVANLGLIAYSGSCRAFTPIVNINTDDNDQAGTISALHRRFNLVNAGGLTPSGSTPTRGALQGAKNALTTAFNQDAKRSCGRTYGVILLTDGESNYCNPGNSSWRSCPNDWEDYPAGRSDELWKLTVGGTAVRTRTWVIGISEGVGPCELNYTAYKGRTDASSPNGDGGFDVDADPYLTAGNANVYDSTWSHGPYAYFAGSVDELRRALLEILASLGAGDYTTSAPAVAGSASGTTNVAVMPSTDYPTWKGHLRAFANERDQNGQRHWVEKWDAGEVLSSTGNNNGYTRKIYTWDPAQSYELVEVSRSNVSTLNAICGSACIDAGGAIDAATVDFIRGVGRDWKLGALINSTPAVVGPPNHWRQGVAEMHSAFEDEYADRHRLVWVGSSDGMVHAFDAVDGAEIIALIPPDMLDQQVRLYQTWLSNPSKYPMGQYKHPANHKYGVANSLRFADVWDDSINEYRTILVIPEGPGGAGLHAVDVTHVYPGRTIGNKDWDPDPNFDDSRPVEPLWSLTADGEAGTRLVAGLGKTWSLPAVALRPSNGNGEPESQIILGRGYVDNEGNLEDAKEIVLDPITGNILQAPTLARDTSGTAVVGQQAFADAVLWQTDAGYYHEDNLADEGIQVDLNGQMWTMTGSVLRDAEILMDAGASQPLYYSPGVAAYPTVAPTLDLFAFSSGTFYEKSEKVTGNPNQTSFVPKLYIGTRDLTTGSVSFTGVPITDIPLPEGQSGTLGDRAQVIAPPLLLVPAQGNTGNPFALYLVYDPEGGLCVGKSYIVWLEFDPDDISDILNNPGAWAKSFEAGEGAAGGFALAGDKVVVSQSAVGQGAEATLVEVPGLTIPPGNPGLNISWWYELQ